MREGTLLAQLRQDPLPDRRRRRGLLAAEEVHRGRDGSHRRVGRVDGQGGRAPHARAAQDARHLQESRVHFYLRRHPEGQKVRHFLLFLHSLNKVQT